jgi:hypothetical protein
VVSGVWPTEGPAVLYVCTLCTCSFEPADRVQHPIPSPSQLTHTQHCRLSALLFLPDPPSSPLPSGSYNPGKLPPDAQQPGQYLYVAGCTLSTRTHCFPERSETTNKIACASRTDCPIIRGSVPFSSFALAVGLSDERGGPVSRLRRLCTAHVYPANIYCQSPSRPSPRCCEPLLCLEGVCVCVYVPLPEPGHFFFSRPGRE